MAYFYCPMYLSDDIYSKIQLSYAKKLLVLLAVLYHIYEVSVIFFQREMRLGSYPVYHTIYDNYNWMTSFVDPDFKYHKIITQIWVKLSLSLLDSDVIPFNITRYSDELGGYVDDFKQNYATFLDAQGVDLGLLKTQ